MRGGFCLGDQVELIDRTSTEASLSGRGQKGVPGYVGPDCWLRQPEFDGRDSDYVLATQPVSDAGLCENSPLNSGRETLDRMIGRRCLSSRESSERILKSLKPLAMFWWRWATVDSTLAQSLL